MKFILLVLLLTSTTAFSKSSGSHLGGAMGGGMDDDKSDVKLDNEKRQLLIDPKTRVKFDCVALADSDSEVVFRCKKYK